LTALSTPSADPANWDRRLRTLTVIIGRLGLAYLFFTQLFWKLPPTFGCTNDFAFPVPAAQNYWEGNGSGGLCFWLGMESIYADQPRQVLVADMRPAGLPRIGITITPLARLNALLIDNVIRPGIAVFGWLIWLAEFWIVLSMALGFLTRLGALVAIGVSLQLYIGLANIPRPYEWEWSYGTMVLLAVVLLGAGAGRHFGVDAVLRRRFSGRSGPVARLVQLLT
jgi:uncharacterized membrane protein YphA (DoxX/SURF4 family)